VDLEAKQHSRTPRRRNIAIIAGAITVVAIVLAFASGYLGVTWLWLRPAAELLLLGELVGLIVLERHQLFEPISEKVAGIAGWTERIDTKIDGLARHLALSGQVTVCASPPEVLDTMTVVTREAIARDHEEPQMLRIASLSGRAFFGERWELEAEAQEFANAVSAYFLLPTSPANARARRWSIRLLAVFAERENFERFWERTAPLRESGALNMEVKLVARSQVQALLSPQMITDRDVVVAMDDQNSVFHELVVIRELDPHAPGGAQHISRSGRVEEAHRPEPVANSLLALLKHKNIDLFGKCAICGKLFQRLRSDQACDNRRCRDNFRQRRFRSRQPLGR